MGQRNMGKYVCNVWFRDVLFVPLIMFVVNAFQDGFPSKTFVWSALQASMKPMESVVHAILAVPNAGSTQVHVQHVLRANTCLLPLVFLVSMAAHIVLL
jgi:heme exporter protein D